LPAAAGKSTQVQIDGLSATGPTGQAIPVKLEGDLGLELVAK